MALEGEVFRYHRRLIRLPDSPEGYHRHTNLLYPQTSVPP
jgi:hypothetical protein